MKLIPSAITRTFGRQTALLSKHSPAIMFSVGIAGTVTATVLACRATLHLEETLDQIEKDRQNADYMREHEDKYSKEDYERTVLALRIKAVREVGKLYAPAVGLGIVSIGLLTGAHVTLNRRNAALVAAYNILDKGFKEYRERVRQELGEDKDREFAFGYVEKEIVEEGEHGHEVKTIRRARGPHSPYARIFDETNPCWSNAPLNNRAFLQGQQNYLNDLLNARGHVLLNDAYDCLKMERSVAGTVVGWVKGHGDDMIDFGLFRTDDPVMRDFMNLEHNDGVIIDFNVDGVVNDLIGKKY